jgi:hypothetical protein
MHYCCSGVPMASPLWFWFRGMQGGAPAWNSPKLPFCCFFGALPPPERSRHPGASPNTPTEEHSRPLQDPSISTNFCGKSTNQDTGGTVDQPSGHDDRSKAAARSETRSETRSDSHHSRSTPKRYQLRLRAMDRPAKSKTDIIVITLMVSPQDDGS